MLPVKNKLLPLLMPGRVFTVEEAAHCLKLSAKETAYTLARYARQNVVVRIKRGFYLPVLSKFLTGDEAFSNPWVVLPKIFPGYYIGGWSAAHHFGLTDQLFSSTCVLTTAPIMRPRVHLKKFTYALFRSQSLTGTEILWVDQEKILISNPHKTILDMFHKPKCGGGITHVIECFQSYLAETFDLQLFKEAAESYQNGALFKRIGYISELVLGIDHPICTLAKTRLTKGHSLLEFDSPSPTLIDRWNLFIPEGFSL
jgi:predicted transcriptional regulator of viral defense system